MGFFDLVEQHDAVGAAAHGLGQLAALVVADIAGRRAEQPRHRVLLHIFRHIKPQQGFFAAEPAARQAAGQLGLADAGGPQKQHGADRPPGFPQAGAAAADGGGHRLDGARLADDLGGKALFQLFQAFAFRFADTLGRDAAGAADDAGDVGRLQRHVFAPGPGGDAGRGGGFVQQVDGFVRQKTPGQVAHAELHRRADALRRDGDAVVALVARHQPAQDALGLGGGGLLDHHLAETPVKRGIFGDGLAVLLRRCCADELDLAAGEHRFEDARGVNGALGGAGPGDEVDLVNKKDRHAVAVEFFQQAFEPLLKIAAVFGPRHHRGHVQRQHALALQALRDLPGGNALGQRFGQRAFAHAGFAQQAGVVFLAAAEDLDHALQFAVAAEHRVQAAFLREAGQVAAVFFAGPAAAGRAHARRGGQHELAGQLAAFPRGLRHFDAEPRQPDAGRAGPVLEHGAQKMFVARAGGAGRMRAQHCELQRLAAFGRKVLAAQAQRAAQPGALAGAVLQRAFGDIFTAQELGRRALRRLQHSQQDVAGVRRAAALPPGQGQRPADGLGRLPGQALLEIQHTWFSSCSPRLAAYFQYRRPRGK